MATFFEEALSNPSNASALEVLRRTYPSIFNQQAYQTGGPYPQEELLPLLFANRTPQGPGETSPYAGTTAAGENPGTTGVGPNGSNTVGTGIGGQNTQANDPNTGVSQAPTVGNVVGALGMAASLGTGGIAALAGRAAISHNDEVAAMNQAIAEMDQQAALNPNPDISLSADVGIGGAGQGAGNGNGNTTSGGTVGSGQPGTEGSAAWARGGLIGYASGGYLEGEDGGMDDTIPAAVDGIAPAALSHGEFVFPADVVSALGDGNSKAGAKKLEGLIALVRQQKYGKASQPKPLGPMAGLLSAAKMV